MSSRIRALVVALLALSVGAGACVIDDAPHVPTDASASGTILLDQPALTVPEGGSSAVSVTLASTPASVVVVAIVSNGGAVLQTVPASVTLDPATYAIPHVFTVSAAQDQDTAADAGSLVFTANGYPPATSAVTVVDDDVQQLSASPSAANPLDVPELGMVNIFVTLAYQPVAEVVVQVTAGGEAINFGPSTLTFTPSNYSQIQSLFIQGEDDVDTTDDPGSITLSAAGLATVNYTVNVVDAN
ncbi:MAG TPA: hypothetical protein VM261_18360 [Kofleriaceae bacterium]|nr:hypothetical protein [Kofleriaceae bacterium]